MPGAAENEFGTVAASSAISRGTTRANVSSATGDGVSRRAEGDEQSVRGLGDGHVAGAVGSFNTAASDAADVRGPADGAESEQSVERDRTVGPEPVAESTHINEPAREELSACASMPAGSDGTDAVGSKRSFAGRHEHINEVAQLVIAQQARRIDALEHENQRLRGVIDSLYHAAGAQADPTNAQVDSEDGQTSAAGAQSSVAAEQPIPMDMQADSSDGQTGVAGT